MDFSKIYGMPEIHKARNGLVSHYFFTVETS